MIDAFVDKLAHATPPPGSVNPYTIYEPGIDAEAQAPEIRRRQLSAYFHHRSETTRAILMAEAPGYQGARFTGIAMTCERMLLGCKPEISAETILGTGTEAYRSSDVAAARNGAERAGGFNEPTASIVWRELLRYGLADRIVLWNVYPFHPRRDGQPLSNRTPSREDVAANLPLTRDFLAVFPGARVICIGNTARDHMRGLMPDVPAIRHPANGGATAFRAGLAALAPDL